MAGFISLPCWSAALVYPLGALLLLYIFFTAVIQGRRVSWKGGTYRPDSRISDSNRREDSR